MEIEAVHYISFAEAVAIHFELMQIAGEIRYGVFDRNLVESALARPQHAAVYENADLIAQVATLCFGLVKDHPWIGGNKRTATTISSIFLRRNGIRLAASANEIIELDRLAMVCKVGAGLVPARIAAGDEWSSCYARSGQPQGLPLLSFHPVQSFENRSNSGD